MGDQAFTVVAPPDNVAMSDPPSVRLPPTLLVFKSHLKTHTSSTVACPFLEANVLCFTMLSHCCFFF